MKKFLERLMSVVTTTAHDSRSTQAPATDAAPVTEQYADDAPISTSAEDRFSRWPFTERIANVIANRTDPASIVIGIYGPWGDGKTSVLNMMREALAKNDNVICIQFNPWHFENDQRLIRAFFDTLSDGLGKTLATKGERIGEALEKTIGTINGVFARGRLTEGPLCGPHSIASVRTKSCPPLVPAGWERSIARATRGWIGPSRLKPYVRTCGLPKEPARDRRYVRLISLL